MRSNGSNQRGQNASKINVYYILEFSFFYLDKFQVHSLEEDHEEDDLYGDIDE